MNINIGDLLSKIIRIRADVLFNILEKILSVFSKLAVLYLIIKGGGSVAQGQYKYIIDTAMLFNILSLFGMDNYNIFLMTKSYKDNERDNVNALVTHNLLWIFFTFLPILLLIIVSTRYLGLLEPVVPRFIYLISIVALSFQSRILIKNLWVGVGSIIFNSVYQIISDIIFLGFVYYLFINDSIDIFRLFNYFALINLVFTLIILCQLLWKTKYRPHFKWSLMKIQLHGGFQLFLYTIFFALMLRVDSLIIMKVLGASYTGYYGIASQYSEFVYFIVIAVSQIIIKETALERSDFIKGWLKKIQLVQLGLAITLAFLTFLLPLILGDEYAKAIIPAIILLFGTYFWGLYIFYNYWLLGHNKLRYLLVTSVAGVLVNLALNLIFINFWGIVGASVASSISYIFTLVFLVYLIQQDKMINLKFHRYFFPV